MLGDGVIVSALLVEFAEVKGEMVKMEPSEDVLRCQQCGVLCWWITGCVV